MKYITVKLTEDQIHYIINALNDSLIPLEDTEFYEGDMLKALNEINGENEAINAFTRRIMAKLRKARVS